MNHHATPALWLLDTEVARLSLPRTWARVQASWAGDASLAFARPVDLLSYLRGSREDTDPVARPLVARAAAGDAAALAFVLAALVGVFVAVARRTSSDVADSVADQLSLAAEIVATSALPDENVLAVLVSRVQSRHRRLRRRTRVASDGEDRLARVAGADDPARFALARLELADLCGSVRRHVTGGSFTTDDWRRLVELRVHNRTSADLARAHAMTAAAVRKRVQRTAAVLAADAVGPVRGAA
jgi:hypothetical protein